MRCGRGRGRAFSYALRRASISKYGTCTTSDPRTCTPAPPPPIERSIAAGAGAAVSQERAPSAGGCARRCGRARRACWSRSGVGRPPRSPPARTKRAVNSRWRASRARAPRARARARLRRLPRQQDVHRQQPVLRQRLEHVRHLRTCSIPTTDRMASSVRTYTIEQSCAPPRACARLHTGEERGDLVLQRADRDAVRDARAPRLRAQRRQRRRQRRQLVPERVRDRRHLRRAKGKGVLNIHTCVTLTLG